MSYQPTYFPMHRVAKSIPVVVLFLAAALPAALSAQKAGEVAPEFRAKTMAGEQYTNESVKGKVVLLQFWTTWCPYCKEEAADVDEVAQEYAKQGLVVLAVDVSESKGRVKKYLKEHPRQVPIVLTEDTNLAAIYVATSYPIYVVIGKDGKITAMQRGAGGKSTIERMLEEAGLSTADASDSD